MKTQWTPGPWAANVSELEAHSPLVEIRTAQTGAYKICDCGFQNARLIAMAPEMAEALRELVDYQDMSPDDRTAVEEGASMATGGNVAYGEALIERARALLARLEGDK
jgi:hypothetical protein